MATIKSYTDIEQSKKLAGILPLESADMRYEYSSIERNDIQTPIIGFSISSMNYYKDIDSIKYLPCWSLAALLGVLPYPFLSELSNGICKCGCYPSGICNYVTADSPIDACVAMVEKLNKMNLL